LIQHSAGSGKSNSIAWLAHHLSTLHDQDRKIVDSVIVITDRLVLDRQLQDTIYQFEHKQGVVQKIGENSQQLALAPKTGVPIVITILQMFPFVTDHIGELPDRRYAVIVDEAHSSQSGTEAVKMKAVLAAPRIRQEARKRAQEEQLPDYEEEIIRCVKARKPQPNISFFAFTATPKYKTKVLFGRPGPDGALGAVSPLFHAPGHRGGLHPRRAQELHHLQDLLFGFFIPPRLFPTTLSSSAHLRRFGPCLCPSPQRTHPDNAVRFQDQRRTGAGSFVRSSAIQNDLPVTRNLARGAGEVLDGEADRARNWWPVVIHSSAQIDNVKTFACSHSIPQFLSGNPRNLKLL